MDKNNKIIQMFLRDDEGLFDGEPKDLEALRVSVRMALDFHEFLAKWADNPPESEIEYIVGTIRAGIDFFFSISFVYGVLDTSRARRRFTWEVTSDFGKIRQAFLSMFNILESEQVEFTERFACLLALSKIQLNFLVSNFATR